MEIRRVTPKDAARWKTLRNRALVEAPTAFLSSVADQRALTVDRLAARIRAGDEDGGILLWAWDADEVLGTVGLHRSPKERARHTAMVWGMYVVPAARRQGVGTALMEQVIAHARSVGLARLGSSVSEPNRGAIRLYRDLGFVAWGRQPDAMRVEGAELAVVHMSLPL